MMSELLKLKLKELTFDIAVAKCIAIEQSYKDVEALQGGKESNPVDLLSKSRPNKKPKPAKKEARLSEKKSSPTPKEPGDQSCYRCLGNHDHKSCPYKREKCHHCNKTDHIVRACKSRKRETQAARPPVNYVDNEGDSNDYLGSLEVNNVSDKDHVIWVSPKLQGRVVKMELDTGSAVSVLPYKQYKEHFGHVKLAKSHVTLKTYTGQKITPKGKMKISVLLSLRAKKRS